MQLPTHQAGLYLKHNENKDVYESVEVYVKDRNLDIDEETLKKCIEADSLWELQWYPSTPIGFFVVYGATLEEVLEKANSV